MPRPDSAIISSCPTNATTPSLVQLVAADDTGALRVLYERYGSIVFGMARRFSGTGSWRRSAPRTSSSPSGGVLRSTTRTRAREHLADRHRQVPCDRPRAAACGAARRPLRRDLAGRRVARLGRLVAAGDQAQRVAAAVAQLPPPQREALTLAYFDGLSHSEIAERLSVPLGTIKGRIRAALDRLRELAPSSHSTRSRSDERRRPRSGRDPCARWLRPDEEATVEEELARNAVLASEVEEYRDVVQTLDSGIARDAPPPGLFDLVLSRIEAERSAELPAPAPSEAPEPTVTKRRRIFRADRRRAIVPFAAGFAVAAAVVALAVAVSSGTDLGTPDARAAVRGTPEFSAVHGDAQLYSTSSQDGVLRPRPRRRATPGSEQTLRGVGSPPQQRRSHGGSRRFCARRLPGAPEAGASRPRRLRGRRISVERDGGPAGQLGLEPRRRAIRTSLVNKGCAGIPPAHGPQRHYDIEGGGGTG